ncbi:substance-P receptor-like [Oculina patagonica]
MSLLLNGTENGTSLPSIPSESCVLFAESSTPVKCLKTFAYSLILIFSLLGNLAVIVVVSKNERMWTTTNFLIANMAASDLLISGFAVPRELAEVFTGARRWLIDGLVGLILCKLVYFFQDISTAVSIQSLVVIAIDRYRGICYPFRPPLITSKVRKVLIAVIWIVAMGLHGTYFYTVRVVRALNNKSYCTFSWAPKFDERKTQEHYFVFISIFLIFLPLCVILTLYTLIILELKKRNVIEGGVSELRRQRQREDMAVVKKILAIVFLFVLCITPITIMALLLYFVWDLSLPCGMEKLFLTAKYMFYSNAALNPCVYFILNKKYRCGLKDLAKCLRSSQENRNDFSMNTLSQNQI